MRNLKRFLALALTMLMVIGSFSLSAKSFADTAEMTVDQINALDLLSDLSIFIGKEDGTFGGAEEINRKEMAILASRVQTGEKFGSSYGENVTPFADVVTDFEAILYAHNMGIVIGFEDGTFRPDDKVIYQDVLTMIVRTLGYKGAEMDAGYPSTYINKARELGITKGITSTVIPSWTSTVARQDVATLLYNALFAVKADGTTAAKFFGIDTYVLTAAGDVNLTYVPAYLANGTRVVVQPLNADGSINDMYYHLPVSAFEEAGVEIIPGASYRIASTDNLATVKAISMCPMVELSHDGETAELSRDGNVNLPSADGKRTNYKAVTRYTTVYNNQGTHKADNEIIVYNQRAFNWKLNADHLLDKDNPTTPGDLKAYVRTDSVGNVLDNNGFIVAYYMPELTHSVQGQGAYFTYDEATDSYAPIAWADLIAIAGQPQQDNSTVYNIWTGDCWCNRHNRFEDPRYVDDGDLSKHIDTSNSSFVLTNKDDMYTAYAYDDDFDGDYDRLFFMYHSFGIGQGENGISFNSKFNPPYSAYNGYNGSMSPVIADTAVAEGELVRFYVDAARSAYDGSWKGYSVFHSAKATVVEKYETTTVSGMVTAVNGTKMTIGGNTYDIATMALHNFKDGLPYGQVNANQYIGQNVTAVLFEGGIVEVKGNSNTWIIFEDYTGLTTNGYVTALAFSGSNDMKNITIASIDGYFFMYNNYNGYTWYDKDGGDNSFDTFYDKLETGKIYAATVDTYGYYHLSSSYAGISNLYFTVDNGENNSKAIGYDDDDKYLVYRFENGISDSVNFYKGWMDWYKYGMDGKDGRPLLDQWTDKTDWEFIFYNSTSKSFITGDGLPNNGSTIAIKRERAANLHDSNNSAFSNGYFNPVISNGGWPYNPEGITIIGNVVYFIDAEFKGGFGGNGSNTVSHATDLVYISADAAKNFSVDNQVPGLGGAGETLWGFRYVYNEAVSMIDGSTVKVSTDGIYNYKLSQGFYYVNNGVIDHKVISPDDVSIVKATMLMGADRAFRLQAADGTIYERDLTNYKFFQMENGGKLKTNADGTFYTHANRTEHNKYFTFGDPAYTNEGNSGNISVFFFVHTMATDCPIIISNTTVSF